MKILDGVNVMEDVSSSVEDRIITTEVDYDGYDGCYEYLETVIKCKWICRIIWKYFLR